MARKSSGTGRVGKEYEERVLAKNVRNLALAETFRILQNRKHRLYGPMLLKLGGQILPRINEHSGPDGAAIPLSVLLKKAGEK